MTTALEVGEWSASRPGRSLPPGRTRYPMYRRLGGPQGRSGHSTQGEMRYVQRILLRGHERKIQFGNLMSSVRCSLGYRIWCSAYRQRYTVCAKANVSLKKKYNFGKITIIRVVIKTKDRPKQVCSDAVGDWRC
jgi:hypothetical protein